MRRCSPAIVACVSQDALSLALYRPDKAPASATLCSLTVCTSTASEIHSPSQQGELEHQSVAVVRVSAARTTEDCCTKKQNNCSGVCLSTDFPAAATKPQTINNIIVFMRQMRVLPFVVGYHTDMDVPGIALEYSTSTTKTVV